MRDYPEIAVEKAMTRQEIILRVYAKKLNWIEAAEIMGLSCRHLRRVRENYEKVGFSGLFDSRLGKESPRRIPVETVEEVLRLRGAKSGLEHFDRDAWELFEVATRYRDLIVHECTSIGPDRHPHLIAATEAVLRGLVELAGLEARPKAVG